jgi:site-specific DNA-cytosine methylase
LFSGVGGVAKHCRRLGAACKEFDIVHGAHGDLLNPIVLKRLKYDIRHSICVAVMMGPPCTNFSIARDRTLQVRSKLQPWGFRTLPPNELDKVFQANKLAVVVINILNLCQQFSIPWILENPSTSRFWYLPQIVRILDSSTVHSRVCDYCQYGAPWRKRTRFAFGNLDEFDSLRLDKRCKGTFCSRTGKPHITLSGNDANNIAWTHRAQPYPNTLSRHIAFCLVSSLRAAYLHQV